MPSWQDEYVAAGHGKCPVCKSEDIVSSSVTIEERWALQDVSCSACGSEWIVKYILCDVTLTVYHKPGEER